MKKQHRKAIMDVITFQINITPQIIIVLYILCTVGLSIMAIVLPFSRALGWLDIPRKTAISGLILIGGNMILRIIFEQLMLLWRIYDKLYEQTEILRVKK